LSLYGAVFSLESTVLSLEGIFRYRHGGALCKREMRLC
jgi:hypothetical protein